MSNPNFPVDPPTSFRPTTSMAKRQRWAVVICSVPFAVCLATVATMRPFEPKMALVPAAFGVAILWTLRQYTALYGRLELSDAGVRLAARFRSREATWGEIGSVLVIAWDHGNESRAVVGGAIGNAIGSAGLGAAVAVAALKDQSGDVDARQPLLERLIAIGMLTPGYLPDVTLLGRDGSRLMRLRGTHEWDAAQTLAQMAEDRSIPVLVD